MYLPFRGPAVSRRQFLRTFGSVQRLRRCRARPWLGRYLFDAQRNGTGRIYLEACGSEVTGVGRSLRNTRDAASPNDCQFSSADFNATGNATISALTDALERNGDDADRTDTGDTDATFDATWNMGLLAGTDTQSTVRRPQNAERNRHTRKTQRTRSHETRRNRTRTQH
jgi:hypothetical protein